MLQRLCTLSRSVEINTWAPLRPSSGAYRLLSLDLLPSFVWTKSKMSNPTDAFWVNFTPRRSSLLQYNQFQPQPVNCQIRTSSLQQTTIIHLADDVNLSNCLMIGWLENSNWLSPLLNWIAWIHWQIFCSNLWPKFWYVLVNETSCFHPDFKTKFFHSIHLRFVHNIWSINSSMLKIV